MKLEFRTLRADEIDVRVGQINENGATLLLYKDARCDMAILDEAVGATGWQRRHGRENANCIVSIWDDDKKQWIEKEDTGTESNTEAEKGLASDSFKRACVNWGIGRELYSSPFIWIKAEDMKIYKNQKGHFATKDRFVVEKITYDDRRAIIGLSIRNTSNGKIVFSNMPHDEAPPDSTPPDSTPPDSTPPDSTPGNIAPINIVPMKKPNPRKERLEAFAQLHGMDMAGVEAYKVALVKAGLVVDKSCKDMTDAEFEQLIAAMNANV